MRRSASSRRTLGPERGRYGSVPTAPPPAVASPASSPPCCQPLRRAGRFSRFLSAPLSCCLARPSYSSGPGSWRPWEGVGGSEARSPEAGNQPARLGCPVAASPAAARWVVSGSKGPWPRTGSGRGSPGGRAGFRRPRGGVQPFAADGEVSAPARRLPCLVPTPGVFPSVRLPRTRRSSPGGAAVLRLAPLPVAPR